MPVSTSRSGQQRAVTERPGDLLESPIALVDRLLDLLLAEAQHDPNPTSRAFREQIEELRAKIGSDDGWDGVARVGKECLEVCGAYLQTTRALRAEQENGLRDIIDMLRESLKTLAADATSFNTRLAGASQRVSALMSVDNIADLKQRLSDEVGELQRVVQQKQRRDEITQAWLLQRVEALETGLEATRKAALVDPLTRVANRGQFEQSLPQWVAMCADAGRSFVLALIDVDRFKSINDAYGHPMGDRVLVGTAEALRALIRPSDLVARYGGDEFVLLLANMTLDQAQKRLPEVVAKIAGTEYPCERSGEPVHVTISCGLAELSRQDDAASLLARADEALYAAKSQGRNRAVARRAPRWLGVLPMRTGAARRRADAAG